MTALIGISGLSKGFCVFLLTQTFFLIIREKIAHISLLLVVDLEGVIMTARTSCGLALGAALMGFGAVNPVRGGTVDPAAASAMIQSTVTDQDFEFLHAFYGGQSPSLDYNSSSNATSWSGKLSGDWLGSPVSISYTGDLSQYPTGAVTWSSTGTYGTSTWSGSGSATITDTSTTTFNVTFLDSVSVGGNTGSINYVIPGSLLPNGNIMFGTPSNPEVGTGSETLNGNTTLNAALFSYLRFFPYAPCDYRNGYPFPPWIPADNVYYATAASPTAVVFTLTGSISAVPEPSTLVMAGMALLGGVLSAVNSRKRRR